MSQNTEPTIRLRVDPTNPGQFFACCGLLELADRLWGGAEGWYSTVDPFFCLRLPVGKDHSTADLIREVMDAGLVGELSTALQEEREALERRKRELKKMQGALSADEEERRKALGTLLREGAIVIPGPFNLRLDWWQWDGNDVPKTWAGSQQALRIASAALLSSQQAFTTESPFDYCCVLRASPDAAEPTQCAPRRGSRAYDGEPETGKVEPFYFDARRGSNAQPLDIGFSPDSLQMTSAAYPAVEFLCLVGLQRFRPMPTSTARVFDYYTWSGPLTTSIAPLAACGLMSHVGHQGFRFENAFRTDQKKHKAFTAATPFQRSNNGRSAREI